jgi:hypothetical protein
VRSSPLHATKFHLGQSELVVLVQIGRFEQAADLHRPLSLGFLGVGHLLLALFGEQLGVVAGELLELNEEVAQDDLELGEVVVVREEAVDEGLDLNAGTRTWLADWRRLMTRSMTRLMWRQLTVGGW